MTTYIRLLVLVSCLFTLWACSPSADEPMKSSLIGMKAVIQAHGNDLLLEVKDITENTVISEITNWHGDFVSRRHYYKGLYPVAGKEGATQWELDFDVNRIDVLFPITIGNKTSFSGTMLDITNAKSYKFWSKIEVKEKKPFLLPSGAQTVYILKIKTEYDINGRLKKTMETVYFAPDLMLNLKGVMHEAAAQRYWRVISIIPPSEADIIPTRRPRSATVMI